MATSRLSSLVSLFLALAWLSVPSGLAGQGSAQASAEAREASRVAMSASPLERADDPALARQATRPRHDRPAAWTGGDPSRAGHRGRPGPAGPFSGSVSEPVQGWGWVAAAVGPALPTGMSGEIRTLARQVREITDCVFGSEGLVSVGTVEDTGQPRLRLNLQYEPDPGLRVTLLTG